MNTKIGILTILVLAAGTLSMIGIGIQMAYAQGVGNTGDPGIGNDRNYPDCRNSGSPPDAGDKCKDRYTGSDKKRR